MTIYSRPDKPLTIPVRRRDSYTPPDADAIPEPLAVDSATQCHVTPADVAARMVGYLAPEAGLLLEPSAGTGNLIAAAREYRGGIAGIVAVECHVTLCEALQQRFPDLALKAECFLAYAERATGRVQYRYVLMNPPFKQVTAHINAALSLLEPGGQLVALVPVTYEHPHAVQLERLPPGTFAATTVHTKILRIEP